MSNVIKWGDNGKNFGFLGYRDKILVSTSKDLKTLDIILNAALPAQWTHASIPLTYDGKPHSVLCSMKNPAFNKNSSIVQIGDGTLLYSAKVINGVPLIATVFTPIAGTTIDPNGNGIYAAKDISGDWKKHADSIQNGMGNIITGALDLLGAVVTPSTAAVQGVAAVNAVLAMHPIYGIVKVSQLTKGDKKTAVHEIVNQGWNAFLTKYATDKQKKEIGYKSDTTTKQTTDNKDTSTTTGIGTMGMMGALGLVAIVMMFMSKNK